MNIFTLLVITQILMFSQNLETNNSRTTDSSLSIETFYLPSFDNQQLLQNKAQSDRSFFAHPFKVDITTQSHGTWQTEGAEAVWKLRVVSENAYSLNFGFTEFVMPGDGKLYLYSEKHDESFGPFTPHDNEEHEQLWTPIIEGSATIIELRISPEYIPDLKLRLGSINHGFTSLLSKSSSENLCYVDAICSQLDGWPEIDAYRSQIRSVALFTMGDGGNCTGFLVNNTRNDQKPYFLTADHCFTQAQEMGATMVVYWNFQNTTCRAVNTEINGLPGDGKKNVFNTGAIFRAKSLDSDFALFELEDVVNPAANAYFAGWDNRDVTTTRSVCIHHPNQGEKRITYDNDDSEISNHTQDPKPGGNHLRMENWEFGSTELGSSGAPIFNQSGRVVAQLHGGTAQCGNKESDWAGRFHTSWLGGGTPETQLKHWLDPENTNKQIHNGINASLVEPMNVSVGGKQMLKCFGDETGKISVWVTGGVIPYQYSIDGGQSYQASSVFDNLGGGTYQITVMDAKESIEQSEFVEICAPEPLRFDSIMQTPSKPNEIAIYVTGGTGELLYSIDNLNYTTSIWQQVPEQGVYLISVKDENDCLIAQTFEVNWDKLEVSVNVGTEGCSESADNGKSIFQVTGGIAPYYLLFNNTDTLFISSSDETIEISGLKMGTFDYQIIDSNTDVIEGSFDIMTFDPLSIADIQTIENTILISAQGGMSPYQYRIDQNEFQDESQFTVAEPGLHLITVKDINDCEVITEVAVAWSPIDVTSTFLQENLCFGDKIAVVRLEIAGGISPYVLSVGDSIQIVLENDFIDIEGLGQGYYDFHICDNVGDSLLARVEVIEPKELLLATETDINSIILEATGGTVPYEFYINNELQQTQQTIGVFTILDPGIYQVAVLDANGCSHTEEVTIGWESLNVQYRLSEISCHGEEDATITFDILSGVPEYTIIVDSTEIAIEANQFVLSDLGPGQKTYTFKDLIGQSFSLDITIPDVAPLEVTIENNINTIVANTVGGHPPYEYLINGFAPQSTGEFIFQESGLYEITVIDANACSTSQSFELSWETLEVSYSVEGISCHGEKDATITFNLIGLPAYTITYNGITFEFDESTYEISGLGAGEYDIQFVDSIGQQTILSVIVPDMEPVEISLDVEGNNVTVKGQGGTPPYRYSYNTTSFVDNNIFSELANGYYVFNIVDSNNCYVSSDTINIELTPTSSIDIKLKHLVTVYPNPPSDVLFISFEKWPYRSFNVQIINGKGQNLIKQSVQSFQSGRPLEFDVSKLPVGIYFIQVFNEEFKFVERFVKISS